MNREVYLREPLAFKGAIPIFSTSNEYVDNYEQISSDHLESMQKEGTNPFIPEELWVEFEQSTISLIKKYSQQSQRILDVGVGLGRVLGHFPQLERYGLDISLGYLEVAEKKGIEVCYAMIEDMPYKDSIFDLVVSTDVLEHVLDLNLSVSKILKVLKPGGVLIIRVPYRENLSPYLEQDYPYKYVHLRNFDENSLMLLFDRILGCKVLEVMMSGYVHSYSRWKWPMPRRGYTRLLRFLDQVKITYKPLYQFVVKQLYHPVEINIVVRKP